MNQNRHVPEPVANDNTATQSVYVGPRAFGTGEKLYGRDRELPALLDLIIAERIVLMYAPSGAGKTSLIRAGLIPMLEAAGLRVFPPTNVSVGNPANQPGRASSPDNALLSNRYLYSFVSVLEEALPNEERADESELANLDLTSYLDRRPRAPDAPDTEVLIFDQFEDILRVDPTDEPDKAMFFNQLGAALSNKRRWALFSMREDYVAGLDPFMRPIPTRFSNTFRLDLLRPEDAMEAIQQPARQAGVNFTDAAASKLIDDLRRVRVQRADGSVEEQPGQYIEPVQLQVVCLRLWERMPLGTTKIAPSDIEDTGDVDTALGEYYAERVGSVAARTSIRERSIRDWFDHALITSQGLRSQVLRERVASLGLSNEAIQLLVGAHLVRAEDRRGATWFELAHDRLIKPVLTNNAAWLEANLSTLQRQARLWHDKGRPSGLLLRDDTLAAEERWAGLNPDDLSGTDVEFLAACRQARQAAQRERRSRQVIGILAVAAMLFGIIAFLLFLQARQQTQLATSRELAAAASGELARDPELGVMLALQAESMSSTPEADDALQRAARASRARTTLIGHDGGVTKVVFSPDGTALATASKDGTARLWDAERGAQKATLTGHTSSVTWVAFAPDGRRLATASLDGTVRMWAAATGRALLELSDATRGDARYTTVAFSPDGTRLAAATTDGVVQAWDASSGSEVLRFTAHAGPAYAVSFSPDGARLASAGADGTAQVWDATTGSHLLTLVGHNGFCTGVAFSPDGKRLATTSEDQTTRVWDADSGQELLTFELQAGGLAQVAFSPDGSRVATAGADRTARVWDANSGRPLVVLAGHSAPVIGVAFSPDGSQLATASEDKTAKIWDATSTYVPGRVYSVTASPDGASVATGGSDGTVRVWDAELKRQRLVLRHMAVNAGSVYTVAFSPDGKHLSSVGDDGTARIWDAFSGQPTLAIPAHAGPANFVSFSPEGGRLSTAGLADGLAKVWEFPSGRNLLTLSGHARILTQSVFSPDGTRLATVGLTDGTVKVWDALDGSALVSLNVQPTYGINGVELRNAFFTVAFSPDSTRLVTGRGDGAIQTWEVATGREILSIANNSSYVIGLAVSPDGKTIASSSVDAIAKVWDARSGRDLATMSHIGDAGVVFSPDGTRLLAVGDDGQWYYYFVRRDDLLTYARGRVTRPWELSECERYLHRTDCPGPR